MMSLVKAVPDGLKDCECKKMALCERLPIPYVPEKDSVQDTVSSFKDNHLKTLINEGTELRVPIWHSGMREAFLIHVGSAREAIKKKGYFKSFEECSETFADKREKIKELKDQFKALKEASETSARLWVKLELMENPTKIPKRLRLKPVKKAQPPCAPQSRLSLSKPWRPQRKPGRNVIRRLRTCSSSTPTFCLSTQGTCGTRLSRNKPMSIPIRTFKG